MKLKRTLKKIQEKIIDYLIPDEDNQEKWENDEEIKIEFDLWRPILLGDWSKQISKNNYDKNNHRDLDKLLIKNRIRKSDLVEMIESEVNTKNKKVAPYYNFNVNPNLYFLLYEELNEELELELFCNIDKKSDKIENIDFEFPCNIRDETKYLIMFHFKIWQMFLDYEDLFGEDFIKEFLVGKVSIQRKFSTDNMLRYVDLCYEINNFNLCIEVNEIHHMEKKDYIRARDIEIRNKCLVMDIDIGRILDDKNILNDACKKFIFNFCKYCYKNSNDEKLKAKIVILYFSEIKQLDYSLTSLLVNILKGFEKVKLGDIIKLRGLGEIDMTIDEIIEEYYPDYEPSDFRNGKGKMKLEKILKNTRLVRKSLMIF